MAGCDPFDVKFSGSADQLFMKISSMVQDAGGTIVGGPSAGKVSVPILFGRVEATYQVSGQKAKITVSRKPALISCKAIRNFIDSQLPTVEAIDMAEL